MPPVTAWQSVVDSTVGPEGVANILYAKLQGLQHRLILFDVNRHDVLGSVQRPAAGALIDRLTTGARSHTLDVVTNTKTRDRRISVRHMIRNGSPGVRDTALEWPETLVSVGHVALPSGPMTRSTDWIRAVAMPDSPASAPGCFAVKAAR